MGQAMNDSTCYDKETELMMQAYAQADIALHCGMTGTFYFYRWGFWREIVVANGEIRARIVKDNGTRQKV
jgi:hypothetical protein